VPPAGGRDDARGGNRRHLPGYGPVSAAQPCGILPVTVRQLLASLEAADRDRVRAAARIRASSPSEYPGQELWRHARSNILIINPDAPPATKTANGSASANPPGAHLTCAPAPLLPGRQGR
jgi:hypothetical protein